MARLHIIGAHSNWAAYSNQLSLTLLTLVSLYGVEITEQMIDGAMLSLRGNADAGVPGRDHSVNSGFVA